MPTHQKAMRTLRELYAAAGRFDELEALYRGQGQWEELCEILTSVAERVPATERASMRLYTRVAEIAQHELQVARARGQGLRAHPGHRCREP